MNIKPEYVVLLIHIFFCLILALLIFFRGSHLRKEYLIPVCILPIVGPLIAAVIEWMNIVGWQGRKNSELILPEMEEDILWKTLKSKHEDHDIVPLEEAILIDEIKIRRKLMLQTLYGDPQKYLDVLMIAKNNDDVETTHYATTTISHIQRQFQTKIQKLAYATELFPDDLTLLDEYINTISSYIDSGLLEEHLLRSQRIRYANALDRKLAWLELDEDALIKKLNNSLGLGDYLSAYEASETLKQYWPHNERTWIEALRTCVEAHDREKLQETLEEIQVIDIEWSKQGREQVDIWLKGLRQ